MSSLIDIEDALLARAEAVIGTGLRAYRPLPGGLSQLAALLGRNLIVPPAVFAAWSGSERRATAAGLQLVSTWALIAVVQHPMGEVARRRGDPTTLGAYAIAELLSAALHDYTLSGVGTCTVLRLAPIDAPALEQMAVSIAELRLSITHDVEEWGTLRLDTLPPFETFVAEYDLAPADGTPEATDTVTLPQDAEDTTVYPFDLFVDPADGAHTDDGLTADTAIRSLSAALAMAVAGDRIGIKAGSVIRGELLAGYSQARLTIGKWGEGANPIIVGSQLVTSGWAQAGDEWLRLWDEAAPNVYLRGSDYSVLTPLTLGTYGALLPGEYAMDGGNTTLAIRLPDDSDPNGQNIEIPPLTEENSGLLDVRTTAKGWTVSDLDLLLGGRSGVYSSASGLTVARCRLAYNTYDGYGAFAGASAQLIDGCTIERNGNQGRDAEAGDGISFHGTTQGEIVGSIIRFNDKAEINGHASATVTARRNLIVTETEWGWRIFDASRLGGAHRFESNLLVCLGTAGTEDAMTLDSDVPVTIVNNTLVNLGAAQTGILMSNAAMTVSPTIRNNIVVGFARGMTFTGDLPIDADYNALFDNLTDYYVGAGLGLTPGAHDIDADPLFADAPSYDFHIPLASPCAGAGIDTDAALDYDGQPFASPPSLGALEAA